MAAPERTDLVVVGAGIVGLAHAVVAAERGASVVVVERDERPVGASIRNFGHICVTAQSGRALAYGEVARGRWVELGETAGFHVQEVGTLVVARGDDELAVLSELAGERGAGIDMLGRAGMCERVPGCADDVVGGAHLLADLRVDPVDAMSALTCWLAGLPGVDLRFSTTVLGLEPRCVHTSRGDIEADRVVVCVNHDVDRLLPDIASTAGLKRCVLQMLNVEVPGSPTYRHAVLTGTSLLRYSGFTSQPSAALVRSRITRERPELLAAGVNLMFTQRPDGSITLGDTHAYSETVDPFRDEGLDELLLAEARGLLGVPSLRVRRRWQGVYASGEGEYLVESPLDGVRVVAVTAGIGMTTAFGLAPDVLDGLLG